MIIISEKKEWKGMHGGSVRGKGFEDTRKERKTHSQRKMAIASREKLLRSK